MTESLIKLIPTDERVERGNMIRNPIREKARGVYARVFSVGQSEFYSSAQAGIELEVKFDIWAHEYRGELLVEWNGREYPVIRSYRKGIDRVELTCAKTTSRREAGLRAER